MRQLAFAVACALAVLLLLLSAPWHVKSRNSGTILYIGWALVGNLVYLVNSIVWNGNIANPAPVWCDIATKLIIGLNVALPCVSLCIQRRLHSISTISQVGPTHDQRRREIYIDLSIGLAFPVLIMILHYIVQGHRFDIYEDYGCWPDIYLSWPAYVLVLLWPTVISSVSLVYAGLTFRNFLRRRATFNELLKTQGTGLNMNRYVRLMALASVEMIIVFPMSMVALVQNASIGLNPWISWENTHYNFGRISYITHFFFKMSPKGNVVIFELTRWCMPLAGVLFFLFFGLASESRKQYRQTYRALKRAVGMPDTLSYSDRKDTPLTATTARSPHPGRHGFAHRQSGSTAPLNTPLDGKKRPDTFAWMEEGLPYDNDMPQPPSLAYDAKQRRSYGHTPCTPSTSTSASYSYADGASTIGRQDSISSSRSGKTMRDSQDQYDSRYKDGDGDDDATICGVPTSLKRADSIDKPLPEIPFQDFAEFRRSQMDKRRSAAEVAVVDDDDEDEVDTSRRSAADVDLEAQAPQVQIFVSSPTNTSFDREDLDRPEEDDGQTDVDHSTPVLSTRALAPLPTRSLAPPNEARPLSAAGSILSEDGAETVFFTPSPGRLSLFPIEFEVATLAESNPLQSGPFTSSEVPPPTL